MNQAQEKVVNYYKEHALNELSFRNNMNNAYEIKTMEIEDCKYFVSMVIEVGMKYDEGSLASIFCRERVHIFIGPKGGIKYPLTRKRKDGTYYHYEKSLGKYGSLLGISIEQKKY